MNQPAEDAIRDYQSWADQVMSDANRRLKFTQPLYHYTNLGGFEGILSSQTIRLTEFRSVNDWAEIQHGLDLINKVCGYHRDKFDYIVAHLLNKLAEMSHIDTVSRLLRYFIGCLSTKKDDLDQWKGYADDGRGFAIGFVGSHFEPTDSANVPHTNVFAAPVIYDPSAAEKRIATVVDHIVHLGRQAATKDSTLADNWRAMDEFATEMALQALASPLIWYCITTKADGFQSEAEVRLSRFAQEVHLTSYIKTRPDRVHYVEYQMPMRDQTTIAEIWVGPSSPPDAESKARSFLHRIGADTNIPIQRSRHTYRSRKPA